MFNENEINELKNKLDSNGKLIITDDMPQKIKERYEFINSQNLNLVEILSRKVNLNSDEDDDDEDSIEVLNNDEQEYDVSDDDNEIIDASDDNISEDDSVSVEDLENFF